MVFLLDDELGTRHGPALGERLDLVFHELRVMLTSGAKSND